MKLCLHQYHVSRVVLVVLLALVLSACALSPKKAESRIASDDLLAQQFEIVDKNLAQMPSGERVVLYVGSAQHSQSLVFQRDVLLVQKHLLAVNPRLQSIILSNEPQTSKLLYPFATLHTLKQTFDRIAIWSKKYALTLVVLISTHGNIDILSSNVANEYYTPIQSKHLQPWLDELGDTPTTVILSACYSGSFLPKLASAKRIVLTAAAADRNSFGCSYHAANTYFIGELFGSSFNPTKTWQQNFDVARQGIEQREKAMQAAAPSNPQSSIPNSWVDEKVVDFLMPRQAR